jgi:putative ABC transport system permease protein
VLQEVAVNPTVLAFAVMCVLATACLTGIAPALRSTRADGERLMLGEGRGITPDRARMGLIGGLVITEVALTLILFLSAGLLVRSAFYVRDVDPGFNPSRVLTLTVSLPENKFDWNHNAVFARQAIDAVRSLPTVEDAAVIQGIPMREGSFYGSGVIDGYVPRSPTEEPIWRIRVVSPRYWNVMQIPIIAGRELDERDDEGERGFPRSVVVSRSFANRYWPDRDALGKRIGVDQVRAGLRPQSEIWWMTVVGVVGDVRYAGLETDPTVDVYYPQALFPQAAITLLVRTRDNPLNDVSQIRARIGGVDRDAFVTDVRTMEQVIAASQANRRASTLLVSVVTTFALCLLLTGVYSVISQWIGQRRGEMAIRVALGATRSHTIALAMRAAIRPAVVGMALGLLGGLMATRFVRTMLFGIPRYDLATWLCACVSIFLACISAGYIPARRAAEVDPIIALRAELKQGVISRRQDNTGINSVEPPASIRWCR